MFQVTSTFIVVNNASTTKDTPNMVNYYIYSGTNIQNNTSYDLTLKIIGYKLNKNQPIVFA